MARQDFIDQLKALGFDPKEWGDNRVSFEYAIPVGKFIGRKIQLGFLVGEDFPANPPGGLYVSPHLLPIKPSGSLHPTDGIHDRKDFGDGWQYWSRPFPNWGGTDRTVRTYMAFIRRLFETQ